MEESKLSRDSLINDHADLRLAKKHNVNFNQHASMIRMLDFPDIHEYDVCECCNLPIDAPLFPITCPLKNLSELGIGFPLYFYFTLNAMIILALTIIIAAIPCMVSNLLAGHSGDWGEGSESWEIDISIGAYGNTSSVPKWQGILHSICSLIMIINTIQLRRFLGKKTRHIDILSFSPARYAVWIRGLDKNYNRDELKTFLEDNGREDGRFAEVYDISSAYDIRSFQRAKKRYEKYQRKLIFTKAYFEKYRAHPQSSMMCCKYYPSQRELKLQIQIQKQTYKAIEKNILDGLKNIGVCFVTFQKKSDAKAVAEHWDQGAFFRFFHTLCNCLYDNRLSFKGKHISLKQAPEPSDIIWENLSLNPYQRNCRRIITALATILLLAGSLTSVYFLKARQREMYKDYTNKSELNRTTLSLMQVEAFSLLVSLSILTINQLIDAFVRVLSYKEKHHTWTNFYKASSHKLVIGLSLNSAIILIIVNASSTEDLFKPYGLVNDVFFLLTATSILNPLVYFFHPIWIYTLWRRGEAKNQKDGTLGLTQTKANEIWENPSIDIIQLYPNIIVTLIVAFIFAPLFPFGLLIAFCGVFFQYWTDKYLLLRRSSRPRQLGKGLSISMQSWLPIIIFIYSVRNK